MGRSREIKAVAQEVAPNLASVKSEYQMQRCFHNGGGTSEGCSYMQVDVVTARLIEHVVVAARLSCRFPSMSLVIERHHCRS